MCWSPTNKRHKAIAKIAQIDIPIIKVGTSLEPEIFISDVMAAEYRLNEPVPRIRIHPLLAGQIDEGYHFYAPNMITIRPILDDLPTRGISSRFIPYDIHEVFGINTVIAKGFIPKGTVYYINSRGEGVAERIYLTEMTKP